MIQPGFTANRSVSLVSSGPVLVDPIAGSFIRQKEPPNACGRRQYSQAHLREPTSRQMVGASWKEMS